MKKSTEKLCSPERNAMQLRFLDDNVAAAAARLFLQDTHECEAAAVTKVCWDASTLLVDHEHSWRGKGQRWHQKLNVLESSAASILVGEFVFLSGDWALLPGKSTGRQLRLYRGDADAAGKAILISDDVHCETHRCGKEQPEPVVVDAQSPAFELCGHDVVIDPWTYVGMGTCKHRPELRSPLLNINLFPSIGEDYPAILRHELTLGISSARGATARIAGVMAAAKKVVITDHFNSAVATIDQAKALYKASGVTLLLWSDLEVGKK
jgi:hypothetical protein